MTALSIVAVSRVGVAQIARLRAAATRRASTSWYRFGGLDDAAAEAFVADIIPAVHAMQEAAALATGSYLGAIIGTTPRIDVAAALTSRGVAAADVYHRAAVEARTAIANGHDWPTAMRYAAQRATTLAETDVQLAHRAAAGQALEQAGSRVVGYRRMPDATACELCLIAATQRYHIGQLMPIHNHCGCGVAPIIGTQDPGRIIDRQAHDRLKASGAIDRISEQRAAALARVAAGDAPATELVAVHEHGELGPVLTPAGQHFTTNPAARIVAELTAV